MMARHSLPQNLLERRLGGRVSSQIQTEHYRRAGDVWTSTAIDADSKLIVSYMVGHSGAETAAFVMDDVADRLDGRVQLTTDGHKTYLNTVGARVGRRLDRRAGGKAEQARFLQEAGCSLSDGLNRDQPHNHSCVDIVHTKQTYISSRT